MAGDPYDSTTTVTSWTCSPTSTGTYSTVSGYDDCSYTYTTGIGSISKKEEIERQEKIIELIQKEIILDMKRSWTKNKKEFKPAPVRRPDIQLQNICFNGRGWA